MLFRLKQNIDGLVDEMLDKLPEEVWISEKTTFLDPAIAGGQFVANIEDRLRKYGHSDENISKRVYGFSNSPMSIAYVLNKNNLIGNYKVKNFLEDNIKMKFDVIVGNPPYQATNDDGNRKDQASNLWTEFWIKSLEMGDIVALITPTSWLSPSSDYGKNKRLWDTFTKYSSYANVTDVKKYFPNVGSTFGYVVVNKHSNDGITFSNNESSKLGFIPISNPDIVEKNITFDETKNIGGVYATNQSNNNIRRVAIPITRAITDDSIQILEGNELPVGGSDKPGLWYYVYAGNDCERIRDRIKECKDILNIYCRWSGFLNLKIVKMIKLDN